MRMSIRGRHTPSPLARSRYASSSASRAIAGVSTSRTTALSIRSVVSLAAAHSSTPGVASACATDRRLVQLGPAVVLVEHLPGVEHAHPHAIERRIFGAYGGKVGHVGEHLLAVANEV